MRWSKKAPKKPGYYWFLPASSRAAKERYPLEMPTVVCLDDYGEWTYVGNDGTVKARAMDGSWWTEALQSPPFS